MGVSQALQEDKKVSTRDGNPLSDILDNGTHSSLVITGKMVDTGRKDSGFLIGCGIVVNGRVFSGLVVLGVCVVIPGILGMALPERLAIWAKLSGETYCFGNGHDSFG